MCEDLSLSIYKHSTKKSRIDDSYQTAFIIPTAGFQNKSDYTAGLLQTNLLDVCFQDFLLNQNVGLNVIGAALRQAPGFLTTNCKQYPNEYTITPMSTDSKHLSSVFSDMRTIPNNGFNGATVAYKSTQIGLKKNFDALELNCGFNDRKLTPNTNLTLGTLHFGKDLTSFNSSNSFAAPNLNPPFIIAHPHDVHTLSPHQQFLRLQIEAFEASEDEINTHVRGRNKPITLGQVGIRCRHCAHIPVASRMKGAVYFPANTKGLYQAAQNMSTSHIQCGRCPEMPESMKEHFKCLIAVKAFSTGAGRPYWDKIAHQMGLVNSENGIFFKGTKP